MSSFSRLAVTQKRAALQNHPNSRTIGRTIGSSASVLRWSPTNAQPSQKCFFLASFDSLKIFVFKLNLFKEFYHRKNKTEILNCETKKKNSAFNRQFLVHLFVYKVSAFLTKIRENVLIFKVRIKFLKNSQTSISFVKWFLHLTHLTSPNFLWALEHNLQTFLTFVHCEIIVKNEVSWALECWILVG